MFDHETTSILNILTVEHGNSGIHSNTRFNIDYNVCKSMFFICSITSSFNKTDRLILQ